MKLEMTNKIRIFFQPVLFLTMVILSGCNAKIVAEIDDSTSTQINSKVDKAQSIQVSYSELFNVELVGLTKNDKIEKGYHVDFSSACMCNSPSILLEETKAYLFGFCKDTVPPLSKDPFYTYDVIEKKITTDGLMIVLRNKDDDLLSLLFRKTETPFIYELTIKGEFPKDYIGNDVCKYFTTSLENFEVEDCGDFDG